MGGLFHAYKPYNPPRDLRRSLRFERIASTIPAGGAIVFIRNKDIRLYTKCGHFPRLTAQDVIVSCSEANAKESICWYLSRTRQFRLFSKL